MPSACEHLTRRLVRACRGEEPRHDLDAHAGSCLRCRLEMARYERLFRLLAQLGAERLEPPPGVLTELFSAIETAAARSARRTLVTGRRVAYAGACVGAALTGTLVVLRQRTGRALAVVGPAAE